MTWIKPSPILPILSPPPSLPPPVKSLTAEEEAHLSELKEKSAALKAAVKKGVFTMMHRPSAPELLKPGQSYYSLVVAIAKRARDIAQQADENHEILSEKPVKMAVEDFSKGRY